MNPPCSAPCVIVTIGWQSRLYYAFVTSAPCRLDAPSTITLYASTLADVAAFAANQMVLDAPQARSRARLVLVDATELSWQRARHREGGYNLVSADGGLVGLTTLQRWLWRRICESHEQCDEAGTHGRGPSAR